MYLKNVEDAYAEFSGVQRKVIAFVPDTALRQREKVFIDFEDQYNVVRTTIEDLKFNQGKNSTSGPNLQQQSFNDPIPTNDG